MPSKEADLLRERIKQVERELMDLRVSMTLLLADLHTTLERVESAQQWNRPQEPQAIERLKKMRDCIVAHFDLGEFRTMCFDLGVSFDELEGEGLDDKARELVLFMNRNGRCPELVDYCRQKRPHAM